MPNKSCNSNLFEAIDIITNALVNDDQIEIVFTDFPQAFDRVSHRFASPKTRSLLIFC